MPSLNLQSSGTLWVTSGAPECLQETCCFSREGSSLRPDHSHTPLVQGLALPAGNGRLPSDPHSQPHLQEKTPLCALKPPDRTGQAEGGRPTLQKGSAPSQWQLREHRFPEGIQVELLGALKRWGEMQAQQGPYPPHPLVTRTANEDCWDSAETGGSGSWSSSTSKQSCL